MSGRRRVLVVTAAGALAVVLVLLAVLAGTPRGAVGLAGSWQTREGSALPDGSNGEDVGALAVRTYCGAEHCDEGSLVFLELAWPPGSVVDLGRVGAADGAVRTYVRDPDGLVESLTSSRYAPDVALPSTAVDTGFHRWGNRLALDPAGDAFVTRPGGSTERWPRIIDPPGCD